MTDHPSRKLYGKQTALAKENFPISGWTMPQELLSALALIKKHAATVNGDLKIIPKATARAIAVAAQQVIAGKYADQFPVDVFQTGSGTSTNMNMNEVLASLASTPRRRVHPNDDVNRCQSSNDTIPSAIQIACVLKVRDDLLPALAGLQKTLEKKAAEFHPIVKTARTHLMDAVPVRLGDEFAAFAALVEKSMEILKQAQHSLCALPLGGTAAGTGTNAHPRFAKLTIAGMRKETRLALTEAKEHISAQSCPLVLPELSGALRLLGSALSKIANDIRWMGSGPVAGLNELTLPPLQAGSSIMPGKVNPVLCESVMQVSMYVQGADATVQAAMREGSAFEMNTAYPVMAQSLIMSLRLLTNVTRSFDKKCVAGIKTNVEVIRARNERNPMLATALAPVIGYDRAAAIAKEAMRRNQTIFEVAKRLTKIPEKELRALLSPKKMV